MKAVVGVGFSTQCLAGVEAFVRLGFPRSEAVLVHCVESVLPDGGFMPADSLGPIAEIQNQRKADGEKRLAEVAADLTARGVANKSVVVYGRPAHELTALAQEEGADVLVTGSGKKGSVETFFMGSVTRALVVEAKRSILVGKAALKGSGKIRTVLATDHSEYADRCIDHFVSMAPSGLGKVTVVCADTRDPDVVQATEGEVGAADMLRRKNEAVEAKLRPICDETESVVLSGRANDVINAAMEEARADLLVLGAHGHGFLERLLIGSTAMHMVGNSPWNVFVVRV